MERGSKVKYLGETSWAYTHGKIYEVAGYDSELDAWCVINEDGEIYAVSEDDLEEVPQKNLAIICKDNKNSTNAMFDKTS